ncbi:MAG: orotidine-5'-phosphate decarboxylase [Candidatus Humimicrobiaceae bacterium]
MLKIEDRLIVSIDVNRIDELKKLCKKIGNRVRTLKLGLELIYSQGLGVIDMVKGFGYKVMLDAKLLDIPNTISGAAKAIGSRGVFGITIHTLGGKGMLEAAKKELEKISKQKLIDPPLLFGVTVLTSLDDSDLRAAGFRGNYLHTVLGLVKIGLKSGIDGVVCSPNEVAEIRKKFGKDFFIATPGIRLNQDKSGDQKRFNTPGKAISDGADFLIVGRSITQKDNIEKAINLFYQEIERNL